MRSVGGFVRKQKEVAKSKQKNYRTQKDGIKEVVKDSRVMYKSISPLKDTGDFEDEDFYGFFVDSARNRELRQEEMKLGMGGREEITDTYRKDTKE